MNASKSCYATVAAADGEFSASATAASQCMCWLQWLSLKLYQMASCWRLACHGDKATRVKQEIIS